MKYLLLLLLATNAHAMVKPTPKSKRAAHPITDPTSFSDLSKDLRIAIRELDLAKTQTALNFLKKLNKKSEELRCLELQVTTHVTALKLFQEVYSKEMAKCAAHAEIQRLKQPDVKDTVFPNASQAAVLSHADAIAIHDIVLDFFRQEYQTLNCAYSITPPPHPRP